MNYTGDVTRGGAPAVRDLGPLTVTKVSVGPMDNNAYLLRCGTEQVLIDAANDARTLIDLAGPAGLATVVTTHRHPDHWQALAEVVEVTGADSLAHVDDAWPDNKRDGFRLAHDGSGDQGLRPAPRRDLVLPRSRPGQLARQGAAGDPGVASPRLVIGRTRAVSGFVRLLSRTG
jgi:glyoxylase-like metal-dependent hydrolase (beta-lactamase superfamily II)